MVKVETMWRYSSRISRLLSFLNRVLGIFRATVLFKGTAKVIAFCVSVLCITSLYTILAVSWNGETKNGLGSTASYLLLPYIALAVAILLMHLLLFVSRMLPGEVSEARPRQFESSSVIDKPRVKRTEKEKSV